MSDTRGSDSGCRHINFIIRGDDPLGFAWCPDCQRLIKLSTAFNNLAEEMRSVLKEAKSNAS